MNFLYRKRLEYIFIVILSMTFNLGVAQKQWSLTECIEMAVDNNLQMVAIENNLENAGIAVRQSLHARYPSLSAGINLGNNYGRTVDPTSNSFITQSILSNTMSLNSGILLFNGFRITNSIDQARLNSNAFMKDKEQMKRDITLNVATAYLNILFAKENKSIAENQLAQTLAQKSFVEKLIRVGNSPENAIFDIDAQIALNEQNLVTSSNNLELGLLTLRQLMRLDAFMPFDIVTPKVNVNADFLSLLTIDELMEKAFRNQVGLEASEIRIAVAKKGEKIAGAGFYPTLSAGLSLGTNFSNRFQQIDRFEDRLVEQTIILQGNPVTIGVNQSIPVFSSIPYFDQLDNNLSYGFGVNLSVPIYSNYNVAASKARAVIGTKNAENNFEIQKDNLKVTVTQSYTEAKAAKARYDAAAKTFKAQSNVYKNAQKRFETGNLNTFELVRLKTAYETSQINVLIAEYDLFFRLKVLDFYLGNPIEIK